MQNVTLSAPVNLIEAARDRARSQGSTLNAEFRRWLGEFAQANRQATRALSTMKAAAAVADSGGQRFSREERNARG